MRLQYNIIYEEIIQISNSSGGQKAGGAEEEGEGEEEGGGEEHQEEEEGECPTLYILFPVKWCVC